MRRQKSPRKSVNSNDKARSMWLRVRVLVMFCAALACASVLAQQVPDVPPPARGRSALPARPLPPSELLTELRKGGYVIYFRHTSTDFSRDDRNSRSDDDCDNQR